MVVSPSLRKLIFILPALLLFLGGDANAQKVRKAKTTKTTTARTTKAARGKAKTTKTGRTKTAKVTLAGARGTKSAKPAGKTLVAAKTTTKSVKETKSTTAKKTTAAKKTSTAKKAAAAKKTSTAKKAAAAKKTSTAKKAAAAKKTSTAKKTTTAKKATTARKTSTAKKTTTAKKATTAKKSTKKTKADGELTQAQREMIAVERVLGRGETLIRSTPFNGDTANPITGLGPIEVQVRSATSSKPGRLRRFFRMFSPSAERKYLVMVDAAGNATKLNSRANSPIYRAFHGIMNAVPVRELVHDVIHSSGVRNGIFTAILGGAATAVTPVGSIGLFRGGQLILEGLKRRTEARNTVFDTTVKWAKSKGAKSSYPSLVNAYRHYKTALQKEKPGTQPATLKNFAERLAGSGL